MQTPAAQLPGPHISELRSIISWECNTQHASEGFYIAGLDRVTMDFHEEDPGVVESAPSAGGAHDVVVSSIAIVGSNPADLVKMREQFERTGAVRIILHAHEHVRAGEEIKFTSRVSARELAAFADFIKL